ncbi:response regulator transcription factor [Rhabdothermincola salaria]|uniref:response regulator transcription factor n=1 Tax=Rhabdothermincola salaria TaxID=2903142 RepID=UPI001E60B3EB|nr:response regulator transcription factor [Rhabdothermincola salaria]
MNRVLVVDDEERITAFVEKGLRKHGFTTMAVHDGDSAVDLARDGDFDLVVLDVGLPRRDGFEVLRCLRERGERLPVILLTSRDGIDDTVRGFDVGADDYLTKPFRFDELLARARARLREPGRAEPTTVSAAGVTLDLRTRQATVDGDEVDLSTREFTLAEALMTNAGAVLTREQLLSRVWGYDFEGSSNVVEVYVGYLRRKLGSSCIETVRGTGYRFRR